MDRSRTLALALLSGLALAPLPRGAQEAPPDPVGPESLTLDGESVRVPFALAASRPVPVVEARLDGRGPYRFFLDTGASVCVLDESLARELGLASLGTTEVGDPSGSARIKAEEVRVGELVLGGLVARGLPAVAFDRSALDRGDGVRGVLGLPLFTRHLVTLDYPAGALVVRPGALDPAAPHVVPFRIEGVPHVVLELDGTLLEATVDSGSPSGFSLPRAVAEAHAFREPLIAIGRARTVNSSFDVLAGRLQGAVSLAGHRFDDPWVVANELFDHVNLGYEVLRHFALTIDLAQRRMAFERAGEGPLAVARPAPAGPAPRARRLGAQLAPEPAGLRVVQVDPATEAERRGLRAGDLLVRLDGRDLAGRGHEPLGTALAGEAPVALSLEREGALVDVVLFPRE